MKKKTLVFVIAASLALAASAQDSLALEGQGPSLQIGRSRIKATVTKNFTRVDAPMGLDSVTVIDSVSCYNALFTRPFSLRHCCFNANARFYAGPDRQYGGRGVTFDSTALLDLNCFSGLADFRLGYYKQAASFRNDTFARPADFSYCIFLNSVDFMYCDFQDSVHFGLASFAQDADFSNCRFGRVAYFEGLNLLNTSKFSFTYAILPHIIDFSDNPSMPINIELTDADFSHDTALHYIYFNRTDMAKLHLDYIHFRLLFDNPQSAPSMMLPQCAYSGAQRDSIALKEKEKRDLKESVYEALLKNFKDHGQMESYRALDIEYHDWQAKTDFWVFLSGYWWGYGYEKGRVILWTLGLLSLFSALNAALYTKLIEAYKVEQLLPANFIFSGFLPRRLSQRYGLSLMYTGFIFFRLGIDFDKLDFRNRWATALIFFEYGIGLLCTGYLLNWVLSR